VGQLGLGQTRILLKLRCFAVYQLAGIPQKSVAIGMLDDANDLVIAGQIFANSHPHWGRLRSHDLPHLDDQLMDKFF